MKKYVKPELFYERYELSQHIADCAWEWSNYTNKSTCIATPDQDKIPLGDVSLFTGSLGCTLPEEIYEDFCYQNGGPGANTFKS
jgi:hypothetical protein